MIRFRISPSPDWPDDIEPLASTKPAMPVGDNFDRKCWTHAKLALPAGGTPYFHRGSLASWSPFQSESLKGGLAMTKSALGSACWS